MEVRRPDIFDFEIKLSQGEFNVVKRIADDRAISIESVISIVVLDGIKDLINSLE